MTDSLWGPVDIRLWRETPHLSGRLATETDVREGRAVFYQQAQDIVVEPYALDLPCPGILHEEDSELEPRPVIVIQAETSAHLVIVGYRFLAGGNGIATLPEVEMLPAPDGRFGVPLEG